MRITVKKWGNSASVRISAAMMEAANLRIDDTVDVREEAGQIGGRYRLAVFQSAG
jgi:antitoxin MazE